MSWRMYEKPKGGEKIPYPMVTVGRSGVSFNRFASDMLKDMKAVVILLDEMSNKIGFWFFRNSIDVDKTAAVNMYVLRHNKDGMARLNCSKLIRDEAWLAPVVRKKVALMRDNDTDTMNDFYVADLSPLM
jgi:hypothetical protein